MKLFLMTFLMVGLNIIDNLNTIWFLSLQCLDLRREWPIVKDILLLLDDLDKGFLGKFYTSEHIWLWVENKFNYRWFILLLVVCGYYCTLVWAPLIFDVEVEIISSCPLLHSLVDIVLIVLWFSKNSISYWKAFACFFCL